MQGWITNVSICSYFGRFRLKRRNRLIIAAVPLPNLTKIRLLLEKKNLDLMIFFDIEKNVPLIESGEAKLNKNEFSRNYVNRS